MACAMTTRDSSASSAVPLEGQAQAPSSSPSRSRLPARSSHTSLRFISVPPPREDRFDRAVVAAALTNPARLRAVARTQLTSSATKPAFDRLTRLAATMLRAPTALISLIDDQRQLYKSAYGLGEPLASTGETPVADTFCKYVVSGRKPLVVEDARRHPVLATYPGVLAELVASYAGVPLQTSDAQVIGTLCVFDPCPREWPPELIDALTDLAQATITEIELRSTLRDLHQSREELQHANARLHTLHADADARSRRDEMTGLLNRRGFLASAREAASHAHGGTVVVYADLDGLKHINDTLGHEAGDAAIVAAAHVLRAAFRTTDLIGRLGGDELAVLVTNADGEVAAQLLARVHEEAARFNATAGCGWRLAISAGYVACRPGEPADVDAMLAAADNQMYAIKRGRRR